MSKTSCTGPRFDLGLADFAETCDLVLCDVWGVIHNGVAYHLAAVEALQRFRAGGGTVILITNAPSPRSHVRHRLDMLGVPHDAYDAIATSGDVTVDMIVDAGCPPVFNIGPSDELALYRKAGRRGLREPEMAPIERAELAICIGLDETRSRPEDYDGLLHALRGRGLDLVCANPDIVVEVGDEIVYCAGAIAARYAAIGGTVVQAGKPFAPIYARALHLAAEQRGPTPRDRILAIGDAVHTDILGARDQGLAALLVTGGIHRPELHSNGSRDKAIDEDALKILLARHAVRPEAAVAALSWRR